MGAALKLTTWISPEEYLEGERLAEVRHEYVDGRVYAMAGAKANHNRISVNITSRLHTALSGKPCEPFTTDMKTRIRWLEKTIFYYPDVLVCCDPTDDAEEFRDRPQIIFEVLSDSTARLDRWEKRLAYQSIPTLVMYVLVEQKMRRLTVYRRETNWTLETVEPPAEALEIASLGITLTLESIYERTGL